VISTRSPPSWDADRYDAVIDTATADHAPSTTAFLSMLSGNWARRTSALAGQACTPTSPRGGHPIAFIARPTKFRGPQEVVAGGDTASDEHVRRGRIGWLSAASSSGPSMIYGDGGSEQLPLLIRNAISSGQSIYVGDGENRWANVFLADLAQRLCAGAGGGPCRQCVQHRVGRAGGCARSRKRSGELGGCPPRASCAPRRKRTLRSGGALGRPSHLRATAGVDFPRSAPRRARVDSGRTRAPSTISSAARTAGCGRTRPDPHDHAVGERVVTLPRHDAEERIWIENSRGGLQGNGKTENDGVRLAWFTRRTFTDRQDRSRKPTDENVVGAPAQSNGAFNELMASKGGPAPKARPSSTRSTPDWANKQLFERFRHRLCDGADGVPLVRGRGKDSLGPAKLCYELTQVNPERLPLFCGGVDPSWQGLDTALARNGTPGTGMGCGQLQVLHLPGFATHSWASGTTPDVAYPLYEKALELGIKMVQFHKGYPLGDATR